MPSDRDKSSLGESAGTPRDPKDPDGLLTVDQAENPPSPTAYGHDETDTLAVEQNDDVAPVHVPEQNGITSADTVA